VTISSKATMEDFEGSVGYIVVELFTVSMSTW